MSERQLLILTFHTIEESSSPIAFPPALFRELVEGMHVRGLQARTLAEAVAEWEGDDASGQTRLRSQPADRLLVAFTFDDGFRSVHDIAFPILRERGMRATVFLTAGQSLEGRDPRMRFLERDMLTWEEIGALSAGGFEIGGHTRSHPDLTRLSDHELRDELAINKAEIERRIGTPVTSFAYPFGNWNENVRAETMRLYACACTDRLGIASARQDRFRLPRIDACYLHVRRPADLLFSRFLSFYLGMRAGPRAVRRRITLASRRASRGRGGRERGPCASA
ncbi:MAG: polysaccharide deacetylase family protein [Candidatus Eisenbacteria bacterium]|nr:polysaccharide deacetylase family protein [Candidatus Eisenbacteria bacterium]